MRGNISFGKNTSLAILVIEDKNTLSTPFITDVTASLRCCQCGYTTLMTLPHWSSVGQSEEWQTHKHINKHPQRRPAADKTVCDLFMSKLRSPL